MCDIWSMGYIMLEHALLMLMLTNHIQKAGQDAVTHFTNEETKIPKTKGLIEDHTA